MNAHRGEVNVSLGGTEYVLRPTFNALSEMERLTGMGLIPLTMRFARMEFTLTDIRTVLSQAIKAGGGTVPENLGALILEETPRKLAPVIAEFLSEAIAGGETKNAEAPAE